MTIPEQPVPRPVMSGRSASGARAEGGYALGHDEPELARLDHQARLLEPATVTILRLAGVGPGMRVLDVGTGLGDVAFAAAELVGSTGAVVGIDQESRVLESAQRRAVSRGLANVTFEQGDVRTWRASHRFDAIVGRLVLLYCPDPAAVIHHQCASLSSGGVYVAMEFDMPAARAEPSCALAAQARNWVIEAFRRGGMNPALGARLGSVLQLAGLAKPVVLGLQSYLDPVDGARFLSGIAATLLPLMERTGVASASEVNISTLQSRLEEEIVAAGISDAPAHVGRRLGNKPSMSCRRRFPNRNRRRPEAKNCERVEATVLHRVRCGRRRQDRTVDLPIFRSWELVSEQAWGWRSSWRA